MANRSSRKAKWLGQTWPNAPRTLGISLLGLVLGSFPAGCVSEGSIESNCESDSDCSPSSLCVEGTCVASCDDDSECDAEQDCLVAPSRMDREMACLPDEEGDNTGGSDSSGGGSSGSGGRMDTGHYELITDCSTLDRPEPGGLGGGGGARASTLDWPEPGGLGGGGGARASSRSSIFSYDGFGCTEGGWAGRTVPLADSLGTRLTPSSSDEFDGWSLCVSGDTVASFDAVAGIGFNIAQKVDPETLEGGEALEISPGGSGVRVQIDNRGDSGTRLYLEDASGYDWCADVPPGGQAVIEWGDFTHDCWYPGREGAVYEGEPIRRVSVRAYAASETRPTEVDLCVLDLDVVQ